MRLDCRTLEELSGFVKGRLASDTDVQVVEHIVQCREYRARAIAILNQEAAGQERRRREPAKRNGGRYKLVGMVARDVSLSRGEAIDDTQLPRDGVRSSEFSFSQVVLSDSLRTEF